MQLAFRQSARRLRSAPRASAFVVGTIALGIGVTTALYSSLHAAMFRSNGIVQPERVVNVYHSRTNSVPGMAMSWPDYQNIRDSIQAFSTTAAWRRIHAPLIANGEPRMTFAEAVEGSYFDTLGVAASLGRVLGREEDDRGSEPTVVISHPLWRSAYGGSPEVLGKTLSFGGVSWTIIGVAPLSFRGVDVPNATLTELWIPIQHVPLVDPSQALRTHNRNLRDFLIKARLKQEVTLEEAQAEIVTLARSLDLDPSTRSVGGRAEWYVRASDQIYFHESLDDLARPLTWGAALVLALVLLVASINVANFLLVQTHERTAELAIRSALGASRATLIFQLLSETVLICALGGGAGVLIAYGLSQFLHTSVPLSNGTHLTLSSGLEPSVLLIALIALCGVTIIVGLFPAILLTRSDLRSPLASGQATATPRLKGMRAMVAAQMTVYVGLQVVALVLTRGLLEIQRRDVGFNIRDVVVSSFELDHRWRNNATAKADFLKTVRSRLTQEPNVASVGLVSELPIDGEIDSVQLISAADSSGMPTSAKCLAVTPEAFSLLGLQVLRGRLFTEAEAASGSPMALIGRSAASRVFGSADVIGKRLLIGRREPREVVIIGVMNDTDVSRIGSRKQGLVVEPFDFRSIRGAKLIAKSAGPDDVLIRASLAAARSADPAIVVRAETGRSILRRHGSLERIGSRLAIALSAFAAFLAVIGFYGVMSEMITRRHKEIALRCALGASGSMVLRPILRAAATLSLIALGLGGAIGYWAAAAIQTLLIEGSYFDIWTGLILFFSTALLTAIAAWLPARRVLRIEPARILQQS